MAVEEKMVTRRKFMKLSLGGLGGLLLSAGTAGSWKSLSPKQGRYVRFNRLYGKLTEQSVVSLVKGDDRYEIVMKALKMIENEVLSSIRNKKILLKPNVVVADNPLAVTHVDALRAILDFLKPHYKKQILIGEAGAQKTFEGYRAYGYPELEKSYKVKLVDLNQDVFQYRYVFGAEHQPLPVRISSTFLDPDVYIISAARMKTHNYVLVTLSLKNVLLACPINDDRGNDKGLFHTGTSAVNDICHFNMFHISQEVFPDLAVIDGFEAMEGNGPAWGTPFASHVALASLDALAVDTVATKIMGFDPKRVLYLSSMNQAGMGQGNLDKVKILGTPLDQCLYHFKPHEKMAELYNLK